MNTRVLLACSFLTRSSPRGCVRPVLASQSPHVKVFTVIPSSCVKVAEYTKGHVKARLSGLVCTCVTQEQVQFSLPGYPVISKVISDALT